MTTVFIVLLILSTLLSVILINLFSRELYHLRDKLEEEDKDRFDKLVGFKRRISYISEKGNLNTELLQKLFFSFKVSVSILAVTSAVFFIFLVDYNVVFHHFSRIFESFQN